MGVPIADSEGITSASALGLQGSSAGQFRVLGKWPSGNAKWVEVCGIVSSLGAGSTSTVTVTNGSGDFGGPALATDNGTTITIATGAATFVVKKSNFNVIDSAIVNGTTVVASSTAATRGLVVTGPAPGAFPANVTCTGASCSTLYSSANDSSSSCAIEKNGPVQAVIRCVGTHKDANGNPYMQFTAREYFYKGKAGVKVNSILRNANYDGATDAGGNTFNSAFKGLHAYELRISPNISSTLNYTIAADSTACVGGVCTGTISGTDSVYIYQGRSNLMVQQTDCGAACADALTKDVGYVVKKNGATIASNTDGTKSPTAFYADVADASGAGIQIGVYQGAAYWPKSLEFGGGGTDVRIGIWPRQNSQPVYQSWPSWSIDDVFLNFHAAAPASLAKEFLSFQHYLIARADRTYYNATKVFPYPMPDAAKEDAFYKSVWSTTSQADGGRPLSSAACCTQDIGTANPGLWPLTAYRFKFWPNSGPSNQEEFRWSNIQRFLRTGQTGRFVDSAQFYRMQAGTSWPHADGTSNSDSTVNNFRWRDRPSSELNGFGRPAISCGGVYPGDSCAKITNASLSYQDWFDQLHFHWYGMLDYYFLTGDETMREAIVPVKDWYLNNATYQGGGSGGIGIIRGIGIEMLSAARLSEFLRSIGDPDHAGVLDQAERNFTLFVKPEGCMNGYPAGCTMPAAEPTTVAGLDPPGVSRLRGAPASTAGRGPGRCGLTAQKQYRGITAFYASLLVEGMLALRESKGPGWPDYNLAQDLAYGVSQFALTEMFSDDGGSYFWKGGGVNGTRASDAEYNGFRYSVTYDVPFACPAGAPVTPGVTGQFAQGGPVYDLLQMPLAAQGMFMNFYAQAQVNGALTADQIRKLKIAMSWVRAKDNQTGADLGQYQIASVFRTLDEPNPSTLQDVPFTAQSLGGGRYKLTWTVPNAIHSTHAPSPYRIKWSNKIIAPSIAGTYAGIGKVNGLLNYDPVTTGTFGLNPATYSTWFGANTTKEPASLPAGQTQTFDIDTGGLSGLTAANFSIKAYIQGPAPNPTPDVPVPPAPASGLKVTGFPLTSVLGIAKVVTVSAVDGNGNVVPGYTGTVRFSSTSAGALLPADYTFKASDAGVRTFLVTLVTAGSAVITVADAVNGLTGSQTGIQVTAPTTSQASKLVYVSGNNQQGTPPQSGGASATAATWTRQSANTSFPGVTGFLQIFFDPYTQQTIYYGVRRGSGSIYSTDIYFYNSTTKSFTHLGGTGAKGPLCTPDTETQPGERHPYAQMAVDTKRNFLWLAGGVNQTCNGNPAGPDGSPRQDMYYLRLNKNNVAQSTWQRVTPAHPLGRFTAAMAYDSDNDVLFMFGENAENAHYVYCPTIDPATGVPSGVLTSKQSIAGCAAPDDWTKVRLNNGLVTTNGATVTLTSGTPFTGIAAGDYINIDANFYQVASVAGPNSLTLTGSAGSRSGRPYYVMPPAISQPGMVYDSATKKMILFGGSNQPQTVFYNQTWAYDVATRTWTHKGLSTVNPPLQMMSGSKTLPQPEMAYDPVNKKVYYHQIAASGAVDWQYDPVADTWARLTSTGVGPTRESAVSYDTVCKCLVTLGNIGGTGTAPDIWHGAITTSDVGNGGGGSVIEVPLANPFVVKVTDAGGNPISGAPVTFTVTAGGGTLTDGGTQVTVNTDAQGLASTTLTFGAGGTNKVTASSGTLSGSPITFTATVTGSQEPVPVNRCDLNGDSQINVIDIQSVYNQVLGSVSCSTADLNGDGDCNIIDAQRIINVSLGGACQVGP